MIVNATNFSMMIEEHANRERITPLEYLLEYIALYSLEIDDIKSLLSPALKSKIENDFMNIGLLPKTPSLESYLSSNHANR